ncbi:aspartyl protease family protein [Pontixanthobacter aquaemixtae]|nr:aspartyl protease family protein [Pontixanthobacter aquaemixtae]
MRIFLRPILFTVLLGMTPIAHAQEQEEGQKSGQRVPDLPPAEIDNRLDIGGEEIDSTKLRSRMTVEVKVNGSGPYRFIVDSGADTSVVGTKIAGELGLPAGQPTMLGGITEVARVDQVLVDSLTLGPTTITDLELPVLEEDDIGADGMIGLDALVEQRLLLDFDERTISVDDTKVEQERFRGEIVVTARLHKGQLILTEVKANRIPISAVIDTGTEVSIGNSLLREELIRGRQEFQQLTVIGVTGKPAELELAFVRELKLGPITMRNVPIAFADVPPFEVFGLADQPALLVGTDLMETFRKVSLDFRERKLRFQLRGCDFRSRRLRTVGRRATRIGADNPDGLVCGK